MARVVTFARRPRLIEMRRKGGEERPEAALHVVVTRAPAPRCRNKCRPPFSWPMGSFPRGTCARWSLFSDGVQTDGNFAPEATAPQKFGVKRVHRPLPAARRPARSRCSELRVPDRRAVGEPFEVHADVYASRATKAQAQLYQGEALNGLEGARTLELRRA